MINKSTTQRNYRRLVEYDEAQQGVEELAGTRKLTLNLDVSYHDILKRLALIEGTSKTEIIRRALNSYSEMFGDDVLFPSSSVEYFSDLGI